MQVIDAPNFVDCLVAPIATTPTGEVAAVVVARTIAHPDAVMLICDALAGSFSDFDDFCEALFDRVDELAGDMRSRLPPCVYVEPDLYERVGRHTRVDVSASGHAQVFKLPVNASFINTAFFPPNVEQDPARRAIALASAGDTVRLSAAMARKIMHHPYDALASNRYDPAAPNVLGDALGRAHDITMVTNVERHRAAHRRGEL